MNRFSIGVITLFFIFAALTVTPAFHGLQEKKRLEETDRVVGIGLDISDLVTVSRRERVPLERLINDVTSWPIQYLSLSGMGDEVYEPLVRARELSVLWRYKENSNQEVINFLRVLKQGDSLLPLRDTVVGYPGYLREVGETISQQQGLLPIFEFGSQRGQTVLASHIPDRLVKAHAVTAEEMVQPQPSMLPLRLVRAVRERHVRLLYLRLSPELSWAENQAWIRQTIAELKRFGYDIGRPSPIPFSRKGGHRMGVLVIGLLAPITALLICQMFGARSPLLAFLSAIIVSTGGGLIIHGWAWSSWAILGLELPHGVKIQLLLPLLIAPFILMKPKEWKAFLDYRFRVKESLVVGGLLVALLGIYVMRSGNFPILSVLKEERHLRDSLEIFFGARPRFKEFLFGHPLFILGLYAQSVRKSAGSFWTDGRLFLCLGLVGQISVVNTFIHFQTPVDQCLLRTVHGVWLGMLVALPLCYAYSLWLFVPTQLKVVE